MATLKEIKNRIDSVQSTLQITSAMKMVSASKLRKAQNAILKMRPYAARLFDMMQELICKDVVHEEAIYIKNQEREVKNVLLVVFSSNKGLCGTFNTAIMKMASNVIQSQYATLPNEHIHILCVGKKAQEFFAKTPYTIDASYDEILNNVSYEEVVRIAEDLMQAYISRKYDCIELIYNRFKNAATQEIQGEAWLPISRHQDFFEKAKCRKADIEHIFLPNEATVFRSLIPQALKVQLYKAFLESLASEHGARMTAMHKATDNGESLISSLKLNYNKIRQTTITNQLLEIVNGAEALSR